MQTTIKLSPAEAMEVLTTAVEGGINYWASVSNVRRADDLSVMHVTVHDEEDGGTFECSMEAVEAAANTVLAKYPNTAGARYLRGWDVDAEAADMVVQVMCFGEVVYG